MREILFRGQRVDNREWVFGMPLESKFNCTYMLTKQGGLSADFIHSRYTILDSKDSIAVKTESIGQFTGLLDKNGNKIFEGDKVDYKGKVYEIRYFTDYGCYGMYDELKDKPLGRSGSSTKYEPYFLNKYHLNKIEVTGNIHVKK